MSVLVHVNTNVLKVCAAIMASSMLKGLGGDTTAFSVDVLGISIILTDVIVCSCVLDLTFYFRISSIAS